ncbi:S8 family peptidase [Longimicrobium terrae]|uniref:Subtilisin family serine protease n=1 Tax=Longimicrobium terrae TaxID=1639882 RepID=A0A841H7V1_9BACT|nr:S8 family peptidase [Longimicrobium terrae]MBB4639672.1 subtilisin family serine protease [Longimicrobium terrae]MBB6074068.1 subtilisin family serine protease [Longimicrobium terrae]NNC28708.1 S8 family serine peptidase [Longimicrobium terrae]
MKPIRPFLVAVAVAATAPGVQAQAAPDSAPRNWQLLDARANNVPGISAERAYRELLQNRPVRDTIIVAIIDSGVEVDHPDLASVIWTNRREVAGNGVDDDRNGYVDDVHGWSFLGGANGQNITVETLEVTRQYARLRARFQGANADTLRGAARADYELWQRVAADFEARRTEQTGLLTEYGQYVNILAQAERVLRDALKTDSLTLEAVRAYTPATTQERAAREAYISFVGQGYPLARLREGVAELKETVEFSLNPDFNPRGIVGDDPANGTQRNYGNNDYEGPDAGHGTHVAGIVAARRGNGVGIDGVAPAVRIMAVRAVPNGDERDKDVANAIRYAVDNGARVINMSFGKSYSPEKSLVDDAVRYAESKNVLLVHAAGNENEDTSEHPSFPTPIYTQGGQRASNWIEVGASSWKGGRNLAAEFSNYDQALVDVFAPGVDVLSTVTDGGYERNSGTSMASPVVAGLAATLLSYFPELTAAQVRQIIMESSTRYPGLVVQQPGSETATVPFAQLSSTGGVVNLYAAVQMAERMVRR